MGPTERNTKRGPGEDTTLAAKQTMFLASGTVFLKFLTHKLLAAGRLFWAHMATHCLAFTLCHCACYWYPSEPGYSSEQDVWYSHLMLFLWCFFYVTLIWCACIDSSVPIEARLAGDLCKCFFSFTLDSRLAKPETGCCPHGLLPDLFLAWASCIGSCHQLEDSSSGAHTHNNHSSPGQCSKSVVHIKH